MPTFFKTALRRLHGAELLVYVQLKNHKICCGTESKQPNNPKIFSSVNIQFYAYPFFNHSNYKICFLLCCSFIRAINYNYLSVAPIAFHLSLFLIYIID